jgi:hypothetical protein
MCWDQPLLRTPEISFYADCRVRGLSLLLAPFYFISIVVLSPPVIVT